MSRNDQNPSKLPLTIAIVSLALAFFALGVAVSFAVPSLRKSSSSTPTTPVQPFTPSRTQSLPTSPPATKPKTVRSPVGEIPLGRAQSEHNVSSPAPTSTSPTSPSAIPENQANDLNEDRN
jgi:hypothetical protein